MKTPNDPNGNRSHDFPACSSVPQPTALLCTPLSISMILSFLLCRPVSICSSRFPRLPVTVIFHSIFPSITRFRRQFLRKMWSIQSAFLLVCVRRIFLSSLILCTTLHFAHDRSNWSSPAPHIKTYLLLCTSYALSGNQAHNCNYNHSVSLVYDS